MEKRNKWWDDEVHHEIEKRKEVEKDGMTRHREEHKYDLPTITKESDLLPEGSSSRKYNW